MRPLLALSLFALGGCAQHGGRLLVVVESDVALAEVRVEATGASRAEHVFRSPDSVPLAVPFSFVVEPTDPTVPIDVVIQGYPCAPSSCSRTAATP